jgi:hypothetical protein
MKNQITILFAGGLLAATAVMAAPATAQSGTTFVDPLTISRFSRGKAPPKVSLLKMPKLITIGVSLNIN